MQYISVKIGIMLIVYDKNNKEKLHVLGFDFTVPKNNYFDYEIGITLTNTILQAL